LYPLPQASEAKRELYQKEAQIEDLQREVLELRRGQESDESRAQLERAHEDLRGREEELERLRVRALPSGFQIS
jgi:hypothetical protein